MPSYLCEDAVDELLQPTPMILEGEINCQFCLFYGFRRINDLYGCNKTINYSYFLDPPCST